MNNEIVEKLDKYFENQKVYFVKKRTTLVSLADEPTNVYYLKDGFVKLSTVLANGNELIINIFKHGSFFPMFWALGDVPNNYAIETMTDARLYKVSKAVLINYLQENPDISFDLLRRIMRGVDGLLASYNHLLVGESSVRVASALLIAAKRFGDEMSDGTVIIRLKLTHQDVANLSGMSRETASVAIGNLAKRGVLKQEKGLFVIKSMEELNLETDVENESLDTPTIL